mmetsp:Transcript_18894/g.29639  ORF Transcript_18894/g.29639 Transcript_18894/m.29639 type:complete len:163 (-) Transcript_18894:23-511(-)
MFRSLRLSSSGADAQGSTTNKLSYLHKLLVGDAVFKDNVPVRLSYVLHSFGDNWQAEVSQWAKMNLDPSGQAVLARQINRLHLTKYTNREFGQFLQEGGIRNLDANAQAAQKEDALAYLQTKGESAFRALVEQEGKLSNWTKEKRMEFFESVIAAYRSKQKF